MKNWQCVMILGIATSCLAGCAREEGPAEKVGKKIDAFAEETKEKAKALSDDAKEKARELKQDVENEIRKRRERDEARRQQDALRKGLQK
jgi:hypothetical protein